MDCTVHILNYQSHTFGSCSRLLSASTFIRSFKRFSSRRDLPALIASDNGKTFVAAAKVIKRVVSSSEVQIYFDGVGIEWKFNVPRTPWWVGLFERLV